MCVEDKINLGNVGNGIPRNMNISRCGADPPKNVSGSTATDSFHDSRRKSFKVGSGCCIAAASCSNAEPLMLLIEICDTRSWRSTAAMTFSTLFSSTMYRQDMLIGKGGQISSDVLAGVLSVQTSCRFRRRGDPKITHLHLRHTCISACHLQVSVEPMKDLTWGSAL